MDVFLNGLRVTQPYNALIYGNSCGPEINYYFEHNSKQVAKVSIVIGLTTFLVALCMAVWVFEAFRTKALRAYFSVIATVFILVFAVIISRSVLNLGEAPDAFVPFYWITAFGASYFLLVSAIERSSSILRSQKQKRIIVVGTRVIYALYVIFAIIYGTWKNFQEPRVQGKNRVIISFYGYATIPVLVLATLLNASFLYYGYKYIVPNEMRSSGGNSKLVALFNFAAVFAVLSEILFVLLQLNLALMRSTPYHGPFAGLCLALITLAEYFIDHGVHMKRYVEDYRVRANSVSSNNYASPTRHITAVARA